MSSSTCYSWYFVTTGSTLDASLSQSALPSTPGGSQPNALPASTSNVLGKLWIRSLDASASDATERSTPGTAWQPSPMSRQITTLFQQLGEVPLLSLASTGAPAAISDTRFILTTAPVATAYWLVNITTTQPASLVLNVANSQSRSWAARLHQTLLHSRYRLPNTPHIHITRAPGSSLSLAQPSTLSSAPGPLDLLRLDPCSLNRALLRLATSPTSGALIYTDRGLDGTSGALATLASTSSSLSIRAAAINPLGPFAIASDNSLILPNGTAWPAPTSIGTLTSLTPASACDILAGYGVSRLSTAIAAWPDAGNTLVVSLPRASLLAPTFASAKALLAAPLTTPPAPGFARWDWPTLAASAIDVYPLQLPNVAMVHDIDIEHATGALLALVRTTAGADQLVAVDLLAPTSAYAVIATYAGITALDSGTRGAKLQLTLSRGRGRHMFVSGDSLIYSSNGGVTGIPVTLTTRDPNVILGGTTALAPTEWVAQVATVPAALKGNADTLAQSAAQVQVGVGRFAVLTSNNRVFIGMAGEREAVEVPSPVAAGTPVQLVFGADGALSMVRAKASAPWYEMVSVPIAEDLRCAGVFLSHCCLPVWICMGSD
ncbi:hypothetical protein BCR44DRAFT_1116157 [Catenaria anguillulae PL171]|uniref:Uncharacterized protein n=1 Tax=Catenaria anguillulae PL171 TaxID=765915 RepID=A0A1Y2HM68_9FUNG|nr:hypothetical protein BCR44DRAFT_1116157 [Catenaria anguillulae PL171]